MATNSRTHAAPGSWAWTGRPVCCREFALAMYRAGQDRAEVKRRLRAMGRWRDGTIYAALYEVEVELRVSFPHGNCRRPAKPRGPKTELRRLLRDRPDLRKLAYKMRATGIGAAAVASQLRAL